MSATTHRVVSAWMRTAAPRARKVGLKPLKSKSSVYQRVDFTEIKLVGQERWKVKGKVTLTFPAEEFEHPFEAELYTRQPDHHLSVESFGPDVGGLWKRAFLNCLSEDGFVMSEMLAATMAV